MFLSTVVFMYVYTIPIHSSFTQQQNSFPYKYWKYVDFRPTIK